ncbi:MAG: MFS transporter [Phaeodactylibacter sp.]|nr:MFS transporter [Phaeodactylibacter sp.]
MKIHRNIILLGMVSLFADVSSQMVYPLLPKFLLNLGTTALVIGLIEGIAEATASFFKPWSGRLSDQASQRKPFVFWGYFISAIAKPFFALTASWFGVLFVRFVDRFGKAVRNPPRDAILTETVPEERRGYAFGLHRAFDRVGSIIGPLLAMLVLFWSSDNLMLVFIIAGVPGLIGLFFLGGVEERGHTSDKTPASPGLSVDNKAYQWFLWATVVFTLGNSSNAFLMLKADEVGLATFLLPLIWALYNLICAISSPILGQLSDQIGRAPVISLSFLLYTVIYLLFAVTETTVGLWLLFAFYGLHYGLSKGVFKAYIADLATPDQKGAAFGTFEMWTGIALVVASLLMGLFWELLGSAWAFRISAGFSLIGWLLFLAGRYFHGPVVRAGNKSLAE